jgi:PKD repeat protein
LLIFKKNEARRIPVHGFSDVKISVHLTFLIPNLLCLSIKSNCMRRFYPLLFLLMMALVANAQSPYTIHFQWGDVVWPENYAIARQSTEMPADQICENYRVLLVQFYKIPDEAQRRQLEAEGVHWMGYTSFATYEMAFPLLFNLERLAPLAPRAVMPVAPAWKMNRNLIEQPRGAWAVHGNALDVSVQLYPCITIEKGAALLAQQGYQVLEKGAMTGYVLLRIPEDQTERLAANPLVQALELAPPPSEAEDKGGRSLHRSNVLDSDAAGGIHYTGAGIKVLVRDDGLVGPHIDFQGRLENRASNDDPVNHGDWVSGALTGAGNLNPDAKGMASGAALFVTSYSAGFQDQPLLELIGEGVNVVNTSYSDGCNDGYTQRARTVDLQLAANPQLMHVFSSGNRGDENCGYGAGNVWGNITGGHKMSKNSISVGNLLADATLNGSSSRGPTTDGRLKPEIAAHGTNVFMAQPDNSYSTATGTSFSAPAVAGCMAQLAEAWTDLNTGELDYALIKAVVMNTANDIDIQGPDYKSGFGHINARRALKCLQGQQWSSGVIAQGQTLSHSISVPAGVRQLKAMIYWTDVPAAANAAVALVNDLDMLVASGNAEYLPWKLNPTPNASILNSVAAKGRDSLNNVEQVTIDNPAAGEYEVLVNGYEIPFGPQKYFIVWEMLTDEVVLTYPNGGEGFEPGEQERIHWDAFGNTGGFDLKYSANGGQTWNDIASVAADKRMYTWSVPNVVSGKVWVSISRNGMADTTDAALSIVYRVDNLQVEKVCPDSLVLSWNDINDTLAYDAYLLGDKYMEIKATVNTNRAVIPIENAGEEKWLSARVHWPDGNGSRRANAIRWPGELKACPQQIDCAVRRLASPDENTLVSCGPQTRPVTIKIRNEGLSAMSGAIAYYQVDNNAPVGEAVPDIAAGDSTNFTFQTPVVFAIDGQVTIQVWVDLAGDGTPFNNRLERTYRVLVNGTNENSFNDFENADQLPSGWLVENPDNNITWNLLQATSLIGPNGSVSRSLFLNIYDYDSPGEEDYIYITPLNLDGVQNPTLAFHVAYANYSFQPANDQLRVEVFPDCNLNAAPVVLYHKMADELQTAPAISTAFAPSSPEEWRQEIIDLSQFSGQSLIVRFASVNDYGNNMYLDHIRFVDQEPVLPSAAFVSTLNEVCRLDTLFYLLQNDEDPNTTYQWSFGAQAQPVTAQGPGPHAVRYLTAGAKTVRLIASNTFGADTTSQTVTVIPFPTANFTSVASGLTVQFTNTSINSDTYLWNFGDGATSTETNPEHTYASPGIYSVKLAATNECRTVEKNSNISTSVATSDLPDDLTVALAPNPSSGDFSLYLNSKYAMGAATALLYDAQGRLIHQKTTQIRAGKSSVDFTGLALPKGVYQVQLRTQEGAGHYKVVIQ